MWRVPLPSRTPPPFTHTNSYLLADGGVGVWVDVGAAQIALVKSALEQAQVTFLKAILLTHTHGDHTCGVSTLQNALDQPTVYVHPLEQPRLKLKGPVQALQDGRTLTVGDKTLRALHTPGHSPGHLGFYLPETRMLLAGDVLVGFGSSWVGLPGGNVADYLKTLERLEQLDLALIGPGHGPVIEEPYAKLREARAHRLEREQQVVKALRRPKTLLELRQTVYPGAPEALIPMAEGSLLAHLQKLMAEMKVLHLGDDEQGPYVLRR